MFNQTKKAPLYVGALLISLFAHTAGAYEVTLKGGSEIKEGAEILKQATEIVSMLISIDSIKLLMLILLGFAIALQGIWMLAKGLSQFITEQNAAKKGVLLSILGIMFLGSGIAVIFKDELLGSPQKQTNCTISKRRVFVNGEAILPPHVDQS